MSSYKNVQICGFQTITYRHDSRPRTSQLKNTQLARCLLGLSHSEWAPHHPRGLCPCGKTQRNCLQAAFLLSWVHCTLPHFLEIPKLVTIREEKIQHLREKLGFTTLGFLVSYPKYNLAKIHNGLLRWNTYHCIMK